MSATNTGPTLGSLSGTPVLFFPVPTPWPSAAGCDKYIYRQLGEGTILGWDPVYTSFGTGIESCLLPQQRSWWFQPTTQSPSIALGPTFVCPKAYTAAHSTVLDNLSGTQTQYTYCCPPKFALGAIPPPNQRTVIECTSTASPGVTISYVSVTFLTTTSTITGGNGAVTRQVNSKFTGLPTSTVVRSAAATVYAPPVNGYNLLVEGPPEAASISSSSSTATTTPATLPSPASETTGSTPANSSVAPPSSASITPGAIAGAVVGGLLGLGLLALGALFVRQRYRHLANRTRGATGDESPPYGELQGLEVLKVSEMPVDERVHELPHGLDVHELPGAR